ncbi:MAG: GNAT family N-acetyltransferase, partial [Anaerolineales bacterium]|nr:GNAT family N-acetyltransferase [Anaerolineales bacterium]
VLQKRLQMTITFRPYHHPPDYGRVRAFLIRQHQPGNRDGNWLEPMWEYMHFHPGLDSEHLERFGLWEANGEIVALAHYETHLGEGFFQFHPDYRHLRGELLDHAEAHLRGRSSRDGRKYLAAFINADDPEFLALVQERGYELKAEWNRPLARYLIPEPFPEIALPEGFRLTSLAEECDWAKVHRVMWRGFNHPGEPPAGEEELEMRRRMFDTPTASRALKIAVANPQGDFVAFCGMFNQPANSFAYVEPVATDPDYRRLGLGKAAVLEGMRRCAELGATVAYVGSDQFFYLSFGFEVIQTSQCWLKYFD